MPSVAERGTNGPRAGVLGRVPRPRAPSLLALLSVLLLGLFLSRASLELCALVVLGAIGLVVLLLHPPVALYALAFAVPFGSLVEVSLGGVTLGPSELLFFGLMAAWLMRSAALRQVRPIRSRLALAVLGCVATLTASIWPARDLAPALKELAKWAEFLLLFVFVASQVELEEAKPLVGALLLGGVLEGLLGIYQFTRGRGPEAFTLMGRYVRAHGTFMQPNPFGGYMGLLLPLAYGMALASWREAWAAWRRGSWGPGLLWCLAVLASGVMLAALLMSWSRGALVALVGGAALVGLALGRRAWPIVAILGVVVAVVGIAVLPAPLEGWIETTLDMARHLRAENLASVEITDQNFAVIERLAHWQAAWRMFSLSPWLGVGTGQYATVYPSVALPRWADPLGHAHNHYLNVLAEGGLLGLAAYLLFVAAAVVTSWRAARRERGWRRGLALGSLGMLGHLMLQSVFDNLYVHEIYLVVAMVLGMVASLSAGWPSHRDGAAPHFDLAATTRAPAP